MNRPAWFMICALTFGFPAQVQAEVADAALASGPPKSDDAFYQGKIATAAFFAANMLPNLTGVRGIIESLDDEVMRLPEAAF